MVISATTGLTEPLYETGIFTVTVKRIFYLHLLIHNPRIPYEAVVGHDIVTGIVIDESPLLRP